MNHCYPEESLNADEGYKCSIMINMIRHSSIDWPNTRENMLCMLEYGAKLSTVDSNSNDVLMHTVKQNQLNMIELILSNATDANVREVLK